MHASGRTDETKTAAFAGESGALTDESADAGTIHLNEAAEIDEQFFATSGGDALKFAIKELAIFTEAARPRGSTIMMSPSVRVLISSFGCSTFMTVTFRSATLHCATSHTDGQKHYTTEKRLCHPEVSILIPSEK